MLPAILIVMSHCQKRAPSMISRGALILENLESFVDVRLLASLIYAAITDL